MALKDRLKQLAEGNIQEQAPQGKLQTRLRERVEGETLAEQLNSAFRSEATSARESLSLEMREAVSEVVKEEVSKINVRPGVDGKPGVNGKTPSKGELLNLINSVIPKPKEQKIEDVKGLRELLDNISQRVSRASGKGGGGGSTLRVDDLSSQADGSRTAFTTNFRVGTAHALFYSAFPTVLLPTTDYVAAGNTVTLVSGVPIPQSGQSLILIYEEG